MKNEKVPMRTCVVTKEKFPKSELARVLRTPEGNVILDLTLKANGRGAYLKKDKDVINKAKKTKILNKMLETDIKDDIYEELLQLLK